MQFVFARPSAPSAQADLAAHVAAGLVEDFITLAKSNGMQHLDLHRGALSGPALLNAIRSFSDPTVVFHGHGEPDCWLADDVPLVREVDFSGMSAIRFYAFACHTAAMLGKSLCGSSVAACYVGYEADLQIALDKSGQPREGMREVAVAGLLSLASGLDPDVVEAEIRDEYLHWISYWNANEYITASLFEMNLANLKVIS